MNRELFQEHFLDRDEFLLFVNGAIYFTETYYKMHLLWDTPSTLKNIEMLKFLTAS